METQERDVLSALHLTRRIAALRASTMTLQVGEQRMLDAASGVLAWVRQGDGERYLAAINFATAAQHLGLPGGVPATGRLLLSTGPGRDEEYGSVVLQDLVLAPAEGVLIEV